MNEKTATMSPTAFERLVHCDTKGRYQVRRRNARSTHSLPSKFLGVTHLSNYTKTDGSQLCPTICGSLREVAERNQPRTDYKARAAQRRKRLPRIRYQPTPRGGHREKPGSANPDRARDDEQGQREGEGAIDRLLDWYQLRS
jgi:hypothetical protein